MFLAWLQKVDIFNMIGFLFGGIMLVIHGHLLIAILLLLSGGLLLLSKQIRTPWMVFITYFINLLLIGTLLKGIFPVNQYTDYPYLFIGIAAAMIAVITLIIRSGTGTLSLFWLAFHILIITEASILPGSFLANAWSMKTIEAMIRSFFSILIMFFLIGVFFDRYQTEIKREYQDR